QVTIKRPGGPTGEEDAMGRPIIGPPTETTYPAWYEIGSSAEDTDAREHQVWGYTVALPLGTQVSADDEILIEGSWFAVNGTPGIQPGGYLVEGYVYVTATKETG